MSPFTRSVDGMPNVGQGSGWTATEWRRAPSRTVPVAQLVATNRGGYLDEQRVARYARRWGSGSPINVIDHGGRFYIADGHHRAAAAITRGRRSVRARVMKASR